MIAVRGGVEPAMNGSEPWHFIHVDEGAVAAPGMPIVTLVDTPGFYPGKDLDAIGTPDPLIVASVTDRTCSATEPAGQISSTLIVKNGLQGFPSTFNLQP